MSALKLDDIKPGETIIADDGFACMPGGPKTVCECNGALYVECDGCGNPGAKARHFLDGHVDDPDTGIVVGFFRPPANAAA